MTKEQCVDCGRFLTEEELNLNGHLCDGCECYRIAMRNEPPDEVPPSCFTGDEQP